MSDASFVATMNRDALLLGLTQTHYADYTGISPSDLSTAQDQATLGVDLMTSQPLAASIVALPKVKLPIAGWVGSYTPYVGTDGVVGVKSGYTLAAGGCVVMAINTNVGGIIVPTYEVILSQQSANALNVAGADALTLMRALRANMILTRSSSGSVVTWIGPAADVATTTTSTTTTTTTTTP
jgi:D-alanyl-D-alanine carboxypeptidase (penicillin-binding protein 5/6)